jgi:outer membrane protein OmpA-like peptidoglycan-associated protein
MRRSVRQLSVAILLVLAIALSGCATRKYVRQEIGKIQPQIVEIRDAQLEQAERIDAVDRRAQEGLMTANGAIMAADIANQNAMAADKRAANADRRADAANQNAQMAMNRIETAEDRLEDRIANLDKFKVSDQKAVTFKFDSDVLGDAAINALDEVAGQVAASSGYLIELQGFTDSVGNEKYNFGLSVRRAESVLRYLVSRNVPLFRISVVGLGTATPVADNKTREGREQNRRVEVRVLRSTGNVSAAQR